MKRTIVIITVIAIILLFPLTVKQKDGGTAEYFPISFIYRVTVYNRIGEDGTLKGTEIQIFGCKVYSNTYIEKE